MAQAGAIRTPILVIVGGADSVIDGQVARRLFESLGSADKTLRIYPGVLHEPLNDLGRDQVISEVIAWINDRLPARGPTGAP